MRSWHVGLVVFAFAAAAHAQERVTLADGSVMQGELVEKVPNDHITIKLATGEIRTIQWSALAPQAQQPPPAPASAAPPPPSGPTTHVVLDADKPGVMLMRISDMGTLQASTGYGTAYGSFVNYRPICTAPCETNVESNSMVKIAGSGVTSTATFILPQSSSPDGGLRLHVHAGSGGARVAGIWLTLFGASFVPAGGLGIGLGAASSESGMLIAGAVVGGLGLILLGAGIPLIVSSGTEVTTDDGQRIARHEGPRLTLTGLQF